MPLHREQIGPHSLDRDRLATVRIVIVTIHTHHRDRGTVDRQQAVDDPDPPESHDLTDGFHDFAVGRHQFDDHAIALRSLGRPRSDPANLRTGGGVMSGEHVRNSMRRGHPGLEDLALANTVERLDPRANRPTLVEITRTGLDVRVDTDRALLAIPVGDGVESSDMDHGACFDEHLAMQTGHPPLILIFHVRLRAVTNHDDRNVVASGSNEAGDVVFTRKSTVGSVTSELAVHVNRVHTLGPTHVQHDPTTTPVGRNRERATVHTRGQAIGKMRRTQRPRHVDVRVVRQVVETLHRPIARYGHAPPATTGARHSRGRNDIGMLPEFEIPRSVEASPPRTRLTPESNRFGVGERAERGPLRQALQGDDTGISPRFEGADHRKHSHRVPQPV